MISDQVRDDYSAFKVDFSFLHQIQMNPKNSSIDRFVWCIFQLPVSFLRTYFRFVNANSMLLRPSHEHGHENEINFEFKLSLSLALQVLLTTEKSSRSNKRLLHPSLARTTNVYRLFDSAFDSSLSDRLNEKMENIAFVSMFTICFFPFIVGWWCFCDVSTKDSFANHRAHAALWTVAGVIQRTKWWINHFLNGNDADSSCSGNVSRKSKRIRFIWFKSWPVFVSSIRVGHVRVFLNSFLP